MNVSCTRPHIKENLKSYGYPRLLNSCGESRALNLQCAPKTDHPHIACALSHNIEKSRTNWLRNRRKIAKKLHQKTHGHEGCDVLVDLGAVQFGTSFWKTTMTVKLIKTVGPGGGYSLIWPIRGCAAGQGMVFGLSVLNRVWDFVRVCPKQGI